MQDVPGLGMAGDVVSVKHGFARNALLPSRLGMTQPKSSSVGLTSPAALSAQNLSAVLTQLTSSPPVELVSWRGSPRFSKCTLLKGPDIP